MMQTNDYYGRVREDVVALFPGDCAEVLEIGAGDGATGKMLREVHDCQIDVIEVRSESAALLSKIYRSVWIADVEAGLLRTLDRRYDCLVLADVLEHLRDPWTVLTEAVALLRPGGWAIVSIPNVRNIAVIYRLIAKGCWEYEDSGILDKTHLRFFTRKSAYGLLEGAGLRVEAEVKNQDEYKGLKGFVSAICSMAIPDSNVTQFIFLGRKK